MSNTHEREADPLQNEKDKLLQDIDELCSQLYEQRRSIRRFRLWHPIRYRRWLQTPEGHQFRTLKDILDCGLMNTL